MRAVLPLLLLLAISACGASEEGGTMLPPLPNGAETVSLLGDTLYPPDLPPDIAADREARLTAARAEHEAAPEDADASIWLGRRTAYLGDYREAVRIYTQAMVLHPEDARLYRHRGHRYVTLRMFDRAIQDFERAANLTASQPDQTEPDGLPNARGIPTSTLQSNIWYHLGLAHYLKGDFENALAAYNECLERSKNPDMLVATSHWLYMTLRRLGREAEAQTVLEPITPELDVIENGSYHRLLLMYKGLVSPDELLGSGEDALQNATVGYGVGNWHLYNGRPDEADRIFRDIVAGPQWAAFGYIAAEADMANSSGNRG